MKEQYPVLDTSISRQPNGSHIKRTILAGHFPDIGGTLTQGWSGNETVIEEVVIKAHTVFDVVDPHERSPVVDAFAFVIENLVTNKLILEGCRGDETLPQYEMAQEGLATIRDSMKRWRVSDEDYAEIDAEADRIIEKLKTEEQQEQSMV